MNIDRNIVQAVEGIARQMTARITARWTAEGVTARVMGRDASTCRYKPGTAARRSWLEGFKGKKS